MTKPAWLIGNVALRVQDLVATLDAIANGNALDPVAAAAFTVPVASGPAPSAAVPAPLVPVVGIGNALVALYNIAPDLVSGVTGFDPSLAPAVLALARAIGAAMEAADAVAAFGAAVDALPDAAPAPTRAPNRVSDAANAQFAARLARLALLAPYAEAVARVAYASRQDGAAARSACVDRFERELDLCVGAPDAPVAAALTALRDRCVDYLSRVVATLAPVVTVSPGAMLPSLFWAWRLYADPARADDLVARNAVAHPAFMPASFEALAPPTPFSGRS